MPNHPKTPHRTVRVPDEVWDSARSRAESEGTTLTAVIVSALRRYGRRPAAANPGKESTKQ